MDHILGGRLPLLYKQKSYHDFIPTFHDKKIELLLEEAWLGRIPQVDYFDDWRVKLFLIQKNNFPQTLVGASLVLMIIMPFLVNFPTTKQSDLLLLSILFMFSAVILSIDFALTFHIIQQKNIWHLLYLVYILLVYGNSATVLFVKSDNPCISLWICWLTPFLILYHSPTIRHLFMGILLIGKDILMMLVLLFMIILFFAAILFVAGNEFTKIEIKTFQQTIKSLFILSSADNFPDTMEPLYSENRWFGVLYVVYLVIMVLLVINFMLAIIYNNYNVVIKNQHAKLHEGRKRSLELLFDLIRGASTEQLLEERKSELLVDHTKSYQQPNVKIDKAPIVRILQNKYPQYSDLQIEQLYSIIDPENMGSIEKSSVHLILLACKLKFSGYHDTYVVRGRCIHDFEYSTAYKRIRKFFIVISLITLIALLFEVSQLNLKNKEPDVSKLSNHFDFIFVYILLVLSLIVFINSIVRFYVYGLRTRWMKFDDYVDFFGGLFLLYFFIRFEISYQRYIATPFSDIKKARDFSSSLLMLTSVLIFVRILDFSKLMKLNKTYLDLLKAVAAVFPLILRLFIILYIFLHLYALAGLALWKDTMRIGNPALKGSEFSKNKYYNCSTFNSYADGLMTMFEMFILNNWQVITEGYVLVGSYWAWGFFGSFYLLISLVLNSIITGFLVAMIVYKMNDLEYDDRDAEILRTKQLNLNRYDRLELVSTDIVHMLATVNAY